MRMSKTKNKVFVQTIDVVGLLKMGTVFSAETLVSAYKSTRRYNPEDFIAVRTSNLTCFSNIL
jgi:hypothetical protein